MQRKSNLEPIDAVVNEPRCERISGIPFKQKTIQFMICCIVSHMAYVTTFMYTYFSRR